MRMSNYGNTVIKTHHRTFNIYGEETSSLSPIRHNVQDTTKTSNEFLRSEIKDLSKQVKRLGIPKQRNFAKRRDLSNISRQWPTQPNPQMAELINSLHKQQETMASMMQILVEERPRISERSPEHYTDRYQAEKYPQYYQNSPPQFNPETSPQRVNFREPRERMVDYSYSPEPYRSRYQFESPPRLISVEERYQRIRNNEKEYNELLAEFNLNDDDEYIDTDKTVKYDINLPDKEKAAILNKLESTKKSLIERKQTLFKKKRPKGKKRFRIVVRAVIFLDRYFKDILKRLKKEKKISIKEIQDSLSIYFEVARSWILGSIKVPLTSVRTDHKLDLNIIGQPREKSEQLRSRVLNVEVRIRGIFEGLIERTSIQQIPRELRSFLDKIISNRAFLPENFLTPFEKSRIKFDWNGRLIEQSEDRKQMMICFFLISRVLVEGLFLTPSEVGLKEGSKGMINLKILGSLIQYLVVVSYCRVGRSAHEGDLDIIEIRTRKKFERASEENEDFLLNELFLISEMELIATKEHFMEEMERLLVEWAEKVAELAEKTRFFKK